MQKNVCKKENGGDTSLIAAWGNRRIHDKIDKSHRNANVYADIAKAVNRGFPERDWTQCWKQSAKDLKAVTMKFGFSFLFLN